MDKDFSYSDYMNCINCCEDNIESNLTAIANEICTIVNNANSIQEQLCTLAKLIGKENCCCVPCDIANELLCLNENISCIQCFASKSAQNLQCITCDIVCNN